MSLVKLRQCIHCLTDHATSCGVPISFLGQERVPLLMIRIKNCPDICFPIVNLLTSPLISAEQYTAFVIIPQYYFPMPSNFLCTAVP